MAYPLAYSGSPRYIAVMTDTKTRAMPSPLPPTEAELETWNSPTRDEQIERYREYLQPPDCQRISDATMDDILAEARRRADARRHG
jgi:hypothetical protein